MAQEQTTIYVGPEEEETQVRERLENAPGRDIILVVPPTSNLRSHNTWRLLHARARELGKNVVIVCPDPQIREAAKAAGFTVAGLDGPIQFTVAEPREPSKFMIAARALSDMPSKSDLLGFDDYAAALVDLITNKSTLRPLTIALNAPWGMGKTTLMNLIQLKLQTESKHLGPITVWFNAWNYDQEQSLWAALIVKILNDVRQQFNPWRRVQFWWKLSRKRQERNPLLSLLYKSLHYFFGLLLLGAICFLIAWFWLGGALLATLRTWLLAVVGGLGAISIIYTFGKETYTKIIKPFYPKFASYLHSPKYKEQIGFLSQFEDDFKDVIEVVTKKGSSPLVVFIDDLDRCAPSKPVEIIEAINLLLEAEHCIFIIAMDAQMVARSIELKYKGLLGTLDDVRTLGDLTHGQHFLEKIIQIDFHIPQVDEERMESFMQAVLATPEEMVVENQPKQPEKDVPNRVNEIAQKLRQERFVESLNDSKEFKDALASITDYIERNPRKRKRFINTFRLQALIANRRGLLETGVIRLDLLAKWMIIVTRWPSMATAITFDKNFVNNLQEAHKLMNQEKQNKLKGVDSEQALQVRLRAFLSDPYINRLVDATGLIDLLNTMTDSDIEAFPTYLNLTRTTIEPQ